MNSGYELENLDATSTLQKLKLSSLSISLHQIKLLLQINDIKVSSKLDYKNMHLKLKLSDYFT